MSIFFRIVYPKEYTQYNLQKYNIHIDICNIFFQIYVCTMDFQHISILFRAIWSPSIPEIAATPHSFNGIVDGHISAWKQNMIILKKSQHIYQTIIFPRFFNGLHSNCSVKQLRLHKTVLFKGAEGESISPRDLLWGLDQKYGWWLNVVFPILAKAFQTIYLNWCRISFISKKSIA